MSVKSLIFPILLLGAAAPALASDYAFYKELDAGGGQIESIYVDPRAKCTAITVDDRGKAVAWDICSQQKSWEVQLVNSRWANRSVAFSPDGRAVAVASQGRIDLFSTVSGEVVKTLHKTTLELWKINL